MINVVNVEVKLDLNYFRCDISCDIMINMAKVTVVQLKTQLRAVGAKLSGNKPELQQR